MATDGSVSVVVANLYMTFFENMALRTAVEAGVEAPDIWYRFVDDVVTRFKVTGVR